MNPSMVFSEALHRTFLHNWYQLPGWLAFLTALLVALRWGGWAERWVGGWLLADYLAHSLAGTLGRLLHDGQAPPFWWALVIDVAFTPAYLWPVVRSAKVWPLFFAAFHLLMAGSRAVRLAMPDVTEWAGVTAVVIWTVLGQAAFTAGVLGCVLARRRAGAGVSPA
jgi:hypothetical protein